MRDDVLDYRIMGPERWRRHVVQHPFSSGIEGFLLAIVSALLAAGAGVAAYSVLGISRGYGKALGTVIGVVAVAAGAMSFRALAPLAYHVQQRRGSSRPMRSGRLVAGALALALLLGVGGVLLGRARSASELLGRIEAKWELAEAALLEGDLVRFGRRWEDTRRIAASVQRGAQWLSDDVDASLEGFVAAFDAHVENDWDRIARGIQGVGSLEALRDAEGLGDRPALRERLAAFERQAAANLVLCRVILLGEIPPADRDFFVGAVECAARDLLPEHTLVRHWPFAGSPPEDAAVLVVECAVDGDLLTPQLVSPSGYRVQRESPEPKILLPTRFLAFFEVEAGTLPDDLPSGPVLVGPVEAEHPLRGFFPDHPGAESALRRWTKESAVEARDACRAELVAQLRAALALEAVAAE